MEEGRLTGSGGIGLYYRRWVPEQAPHGEMVIVHGAFEHSGKYMHVGEWFAHRGFDVRAMDHRGFGQSDGHRCYVDSFDDYLHDLYQFVNMTGNKPILVGHSMGGLVSFRYAFTNPDTIRALVLSSPWFQQRVPVHPVLKAIAPLMSRLFPRLHITIPLPEGPGDGPAPKDPDLDPFLWNKPTPRWAVEMERAAAACFDCDALQIPALFLQAGSDEFVSPEATEQIFARVRAPVRDFKLYPGKPHEIFNDPDYEKVFLEIMAWLEAHQLVGKRP